MAIEPHSMAWMAGQRGPDRRGERWCEVITNWPGLEHVVADGGQGLARGVKLAHAARCAQGEATETVASQAMTMGLDVFHTQRELERVLQRQWQQAERQLDTARSRCPHGEGSTSGTSHRHLQHLLYRFLPSSRVETPQGSQPACAAGDVAQIGRNPYPPRYRVAFAFSHPSTRTAIGWPCDLPTLPEGAIRARSIYQSL